MPLSECERQKQPATAHPTNELLINGPARQHKKTRMVIAQLVTDSRNTQCGLQCYYKQLPINKAERELPGLEPATSWEKK